MPSFPDPVAIRNPKLPGVVVVKSRRALPAYGLSGWVEAKSSAAKAAVEASTTTTTSPERDTTPSKED